MHLMFGDEADAERGRGQKFFVYGAVFGANTLLGKYNLFLEARGDVGIALLDRMPVGNQFKYLKDKFQIGLEFSSGGTRRLEKVIGYAARATGPHTSHRWPTSCSDRSVTA